MSVYSTIHGTVTLDGAAAASFKASSSWEWCGTGSEQDNNDGVFSVSSDGGFGAGDGDGLVVSLRGALYRNLGRYLCVDLARAQDVGMVLGVVTDDCSDGGNSRTVARFDGRSCVIGTGVCMHQPVEAGPGVVIELIRESDYGVGFSVLVNSVLADILAHGSSSDTGALEQLYGEPSADECACAGWDDVTETATCASKPQTR
jgi:hypothetical protein